MLIASFTHRGRELVALPGGLVAYRAGHTTGIPLLYPWANRLARDRYRVGDVNVDLRALDLHTDDNGLPIHGTMLARPEWEVTRLGSGPRSARLAARFDFGAYEDLLASFPFPHELAIDVTLAFNHLQMEMPQQEYQLKETKPGIYSHAAAALVMVGRWGLTFNITPKSGPPFTALIVDQADG